MTPGVGTNGPYTWLDDDHLVISGRIVQISTGASVDIGNAICGGLESAIPRSELRVWTIRRLKPLWLSSLSLGVEGRVRGLCDQAHA